MPTIRRATSDDAELIALHRHQMFADNNFATPERLTHMDANSIPWLQNHLAQDTYIGLLLEDDATHTILASAGIFLLDFPPHWMDIEPRRAYLLNFYTASEARGHGYAKQLLKASVDFCREQNVEVVSLHASPFGRPIYEKFGFEPSTEMLLRLNP
jgi:GNAT superfamily N-acetyltransferase